MKEEQKELYDELLQYKFSHILDGEEEYWREKDVASIKSELLAQMYLEQEARRESIERKAKMNMLSGILKEIDDAKK